MTTLQDLMELNTLNECTYECTRQSRWKERTQRYLSNMLVKNIKLQYEVLNHKYEIGPTNDFMINERGRVRKIEAPAVRDRVIQKTITKSVLIPNLVPYLIYDNYASIKHRGTSFARRRFERMIRTYITHNGTEGYILLVDIKKYFESINHEVLKCIIKPRMTNEHSEVIDLINYIIDKSSKTDKGLNLGSEAPQILAVYYLNSVDTYIKVVKGVKYYGRYMDDIFIISNSKTELALLLGEIEIQLSKLRLEVNKKKTHIVKLSHGFTFLQIKYNVLSTGKILKRLSHNKVVRERRRLKAFKKMLDSGSMTITDIKNCYKSWRGSVVVDHNACHKTLRKMDLLYKSLFPQSEPQKRKSRNKLCKDIYVDANKNDLNTIVNF